MEPPAMSADEVAKHPNAPIRVNCYLHKRCLYAGDEIPDGDVFAAAGCLDDPQTCPGVTEEVLSAAPVDAPPPPSLPPIKDVLDLANVVPPNPSPSRLSTEIGAVEPGQVINYLE